MRGSDVSHSAVFTWYAINCMPRVSPDGLTATDLRPRPFNFLPDYGKGYPDWTLTRIAKLKPSVPLVFDGVWCFNGDPSRMNARHANKTKTNILFADGHCAAEVTKSLPNETWYLR